MESGNGNNQWKMPDKDIKVRFYMALLCKIFGPFRTIHVAQIINSLCKLSHQNPPHPQINSQCMILYLEAALSAQPIQTLSEYFADFFQLSVNVYSMVASLHTNHCLLQLLHYSRILHKTSLTALLEYLMHDDY